MKEWAINGDRILGTGERMGVGLRDKGRIESTSWLKYLLQEVRASFDSPFKSDSEAGLHLYWSMGPL